ncbi:MULTISPECIES: hypothetical protein [Flavobacteriales]|uniref:Uncharacterized protein n=1 Tax=Weeksella virosa (strain ATCC 43766 / DSM 16922 / JCM 21250 / CCUG 30538 / CDC 9751 / IAM 14551 / NBRC 16016 / NCTC 11634 / CL345/78) TaxID=865938 RepID=F0P1Z1_WEEVC|nr:MULTISPECIES: hypothetical protein [Weeksella]ADX67701.1 hypothetical protein Weevi_0992 [Weeksella virosa DSM 16922]MDK7373993.1 hypothetical protein [Weeksella virosa]MDK7674248.1 hypothetical protein [Weeksella virosa]OFM82680.1 hypothetical protein HMPREF2660_03225 [Weeksella sp. HMSC059D05]SUP54000.1 Uncharacterised protein [Weeksella virosa]
MGLITDIFFALGSFFEWSYGLLKIIGEPLVWLLFIIGCGLLAWWSMKLVHFGNDNEKKYDGW